MNRAMSPGSTRAPAELARAFVEGVLEMAREMELVAEAKRLGDLLVAQASLGDEHACLVQPASESIARGRMPGAACEFLAEGLVGHAELVCNFLRRDFRSLGETAHGQLDPRNRCGYDLGLL